MDPVANPVADPEEGPVATPVPEARAGPGIVEFPFPIPVVALLAVTVNELPDSTVSPALLTTFTALKLALVAANFLSDVVFESVLKRSCVYLWTVGEIFGGEGPMYDASATVLDGLMSSKTFMPPIVVEVLAETRSLCIQWRSSLVAPPAVLGGISGSTIMIVYVPTRGSVVPMMGGDCVAAIVNEIPMLENASYCLLGDQLH